MSPGWLGSNETLRAGPPGTPMRSTRSPRKETAGSGSPSRQAVSAARKLHWRSGAVGYHRLWAIHSLVSGRPPAQAGERLWMRSHRDRQNHLALQVAHPGCRIAGERDAREHPHPVGEGGAVGIHRQRRLGRDVGRARRSAMAPPSSAWRGRQDDEPLRR